MKNVYSILILSLMLFTACGNDPEPDLIPSAPSGSGKPNVNATSSINFRGSFKKESWATETAFEQGDAISVFAVTPSSDNALQAKNNYADNKKYVWQGSKFESSTPITLPEGNTDGLAYYAIYPYQSQAANIFEFSVQKDQSSHTGYTLSDLCTAYCAPTTNKTVNLEFSHRLTHLVFKFYGDVLANKELNVQLENVFVTCQADVNANTFVPTGSKGSVIMGEESTNVFQALIVPQSFSKGDVIATITVDGVKFNLNLDSDVDLISGKQMVFECQIEEILNGDVNSEDTEEDTRLESVVPEEILNNLDDHMPIYTGVNPPNIEGAYYMDPNALVYSTENESSWEPGETAIAEIFRFFNQDNANNTLDFESYSEDYWKYDEGGHVEGKGAFISGTGSCFTTFFNVTGEEIVEGDVVAKAKLAFVISGTKTDDGIKDLYMGFVMVEKEDPNGTLMDEGVFRVFKDGDGLSVNTEWKGSKAARSTSSDFLKSIFDKIKK